MSTTAQPKRPRGRPVKSTDPATERIQARVTPKQREAFERLGGSSWLQRQLDDAVRVMSATASGADGGE